MDIVEKILAHHGVKGQKWGVRRKASELKKASEEKRKQANAPQKVEVTTKKSGTKSVVKTKGGGNQPVHPDAVKARTVQQQAKKSGLDTLSNEQLKQYANRLDLEQRVTRLEKQDTHGKNFIQKWLADKKNRDKTTEFLTNPENQKTMKRGFQAIKMARKVQKAAT